MAVPKLRFPEFTGAWEQRKLGDMLKVYPFKPYLKEAKAEGEHPVIQQGNDPVLGYANGDSAFEDYDDVVLFGDHTLSIYKPKCPFFVATDGLKILGTKDKLDGNYLNTILEKYKPQSEGYKRHYSILKEIEVSFTTNRREQEKIGGFFSEIDDALTLHQRKLGDLKQLKKAMLQKMFPRAGRSVPEVRFPEFTGVWEQRKFGELTEIKSASRVHKEEWRPSGVPFYRSSDVMAAINGTENDKAYISEELYEKLSAVSGKLEKGDILVTGGGSVGNPYIVPNNDPLYTKDADLLWIKNSKNLVPYFVYEYFFTPVFRTYLGSISHIGTIAHYTITQLSETSITIPSAEEQKRIGEFFRTLDNTITLHQRKLDDLKLLKKSLLQQMFL